MYVDPGINTSASNLKWVLPYCKPDLPRVVGALLLFIANNTMALTIPILSGIIVDRVIVGGHADELPRLCGLMILMTIIRVGARYGYQMWMERFGQNSVYRLVSDEYEKLHELDFTYFNHTRTGDIMSRLTSDTDAIRHCLSWVSYQIADCVVMFVGALCVMFAIDWRLALVLASVTPFIFTVVICPALVGTVYCSAVWKWLTSGVSVPGPGVSDPGFFTHDTASTAHATARIDLYIIGLFLFTVQSYRQS